MLPNGRQDRLDRRGVAAGLLPEHLADVALAHRVRAAQHPDLLSELGVRGREHLAHVALTHVP